MAEVNDFLNPNSMLTPGIAGSITMMIANTLWINFGLDPKETALIICLLLGLLVLAELKVPLWQKPIYYIINVLVIFSVSVGANVVGVSTDTMRMASHNTLAIENQKIGSLNLSKIGSFFIESAAADGKTTKKISSASKKDNKNNRKEKKNNNKAGEAVRLDRNFFKASKPKKRKFFKSWF